MQERHSTALSTRPEAADDLLWRADADLNVIQLTEPGAWIQVPSLHEKPSDGVKRLPAFFLTELVERFHHRAIQVARPQFQTAIPGDQRARLGADLQVRVASAELRFQITVRRIHPGGGQKAASQPLVANNSPRRRAQLAHLGLNPVWTGRFSEDCLHMLVLLQKHESIEAKRLAGRSI